MRTPHRPSTRWLATAVATAALVALASSCVLDPVHQSEVDALGGEAPGVPEGPYHRAGQPCTICHGPEGPAHRTFSVAGTVFAAPNRTLGVEHAEILMVDSLGSSPPPGSVITNCVGSFFVTPDVWQPAFPIRVAIAAGGSGAQMVGHIGRQGSCAFCHKDPSGLDSPGHVYVTSTAGAPSCPVSPVAGNGKQVTP